MKVNYIAERNQVSVFGKVICKFCNREWDKLRRYWLCRKNRFVYCESCIKEMTNKHTGDCYHLEIFEVKEESNEKQASGQRVSEET